jgi:hypothetical protein
MLPALLQGAGTPNHLLLLLLVLLLLVLLQLLL